MNQSIGYFGVPGRRFGQAHFVPDFPPSIENKPPGYFRQLTQQAKTNQKRRKIEPKTKEDKTQHEPFDPLVDIFQ